MRGRDDLDLTVDPPPDLAVEVDVSRSSLDKLGIYVSLGIFEVWSHDEGLVMHHFEESGKRWVVAPESRAFPGLAAADLNRFLERRTTMDETSLVRAFRAWVRERYGAG